MTRLGLVAVAAVLGLAACGSAQDPEASPRQEAEPALPDVARVFCKANGPPVVETPTVRPQRDGVHLELVNETGEDFWIPRTNTPAPMGTSTRVVDLPPGEHEILCYPVHPPADPVERERAQLEVVDEDGIWVSDRLDCREIGNQIIDYAAGARGTTSDPLEAAREAVEPYGTEPDDVFAPVGYPEAGTTRISLRREGELLAIVDLTDDGAGRWLATMITVCPSLQD
jgi:hypothetical protein